VVKIRKGPEPSETRLMGVVRIQGAPEELVERYRDIVAFESGTGVLQIGRFSEPPRVEDLRSLTFDEEDIEDLKRCRPGDCEIKMSTPMMDAFRQIDWARPDAIERANHLARTMIVDFLESYRSGGNQALGVLHDKQKPLLVRRQFEEMMADPDLPVIFPDLVRFLLEYPSAALPGSEELFYWSKVQFGLKPLIRLSHVVIWQAPGPEPVKWVLASKMLYSTHYFYTGVELKFLAQEEDSPGAYYLVVSNRSRSDGLTGLTGALIGGKIRGEAREGLERYLRSVKSELETGSSARSCIVR
jgi:hypothetical protein